MKLRSLKNLVLGVLIGLMIAFIGMNYLSSLGYVFKTGYREMVRDDYRVLALREMTKVQQYAVSMDRNGEGTASSEKLEDPKDDRKETAPTKVRILCWILTSPDGLNERAVHVKNTWTRRCDVTLFVSSVSNETFPALGVDVPEGRDHLTAKTMWAYRHVYDRYYDDADWFLKADDDTYVIIENLRHFLRDKDTHAPVFFGQYFFRNRTGEKYFHGGAGYVLSKEALRRFGRSSWDEELCKADGSGEDIEIAICLNNLGVARGESRDAQGKNLFHCLTPELHLYGPLPLWYKRFEGHGAKEGEEDIGDYTISFHKVQPPLMYTLEYLIYTLKLPSRTMIGRAQGFSRVI